MRRLSLIPSLQAPKKTHIFGCARSSRYDVLARYAFARRLFARLGSEVFLSSLQIRILHQHA